MTRNARSAARFSLMPSQSLEKNIDPKLFDTSGLLLPLPAQTRILKINVLGFERQLELREIEKGHWIASNHSIVFGDLELLASAAKELAKRISSSGPDIIVTSESKSIFLAGKVAEFLGLARFEVCRKSIKAYNREPISAKIKSTISGEESLYLDLTSRQMIRGKRVALVDDVVTTGGNMLGMDRLVELAGAKVVAKACIWVEGLPMTLDALNARVNLVYLSTLPEFFEQERYASAMDRFARFKKEQEIF